MTGTADIITLVQAVISAANGVGQTLSSIRGKTAAETKSLAGLQELVSDLQSRIFELQKTASHTARRTSDT